MKRLHLLSVLLLSAGIVVVTSCGGRKQDKLPGTGTASTIEVNIEGMTCTGCEQTIQRNVGKLEGIKSVRATFTDGRAVIEYFPDKTDTAEIKESITGSGYPVKRITLLQPEESIKQNMN